MKEPPTAGLCASRDCSHCRVRGPCAGRLSWAPRPLRRSAVVCTRRQRDPAEPTPWAFHLMLPSTDANVEVSYETDRMRFIGRGRSTARPLAMDTDAALSGSAGAVLDPVAAIRRDVTLDAGQTATFDLITGIAATRADCLALIQQCRETAFVDRVLAAAVTRAQDELGRFDGTEVDAALYTDLASCVLYVDRTLRATSTVLASNRLGQSGLWRLRYAISDAQAPSPLSFRNGPGGTYLLAEPQSGSA